MCMISRMSTMWKKQKKTVSSTVKINSFNGSTNVIDDYSHGIIWLLRHYIFTNCYEQNDITWNIKHDIKQMYRSNAHKCKCKRLEWTWSNCLSNTAQNKLQTRRRNHLSTAIAVDIAHSCSCPGQSFAGGSQPELPWQWERVWACTQTYTYVKYNVKSFSSHTRPIE